MTQEEILQAIRTKTGHAIVVWNDGAENQAVFGRYRGGMPWMVCANWTGECGEMKTHSPYDFVDEMKEVRFL